MKSVVVQINGGLGNQLFQYACGLAVAGQNRATLRFDLSSYREGGDRAFGLAPLGVGNLSPRFLEDTMMRLSFGRSLKTLGKLIQPIASDLLYTRVVDSQQGYRPEMFSHSANLYLSGYWQSPLYFASVAKEVRSKMQDAFEGIAVDQRLMDAIVGTDSVCVHVRRGDLISNPRYASGYHVQTPAYFEAAKSLLPDLGSDYHYVVFSDDSEWPRQNLCFNGRVTFACERRSQSEWGDLKLMSACKYFVIANSTFSWWAAWLGNSEDKVVCAPRRWRLDAEGPPKDLLPDSWIVV